MNIYQRLEKYGWTKVNGNSRFDIYRKKNWELVISKRTYGIMHFLRYKNL